MNPYATPQPPPPSFGQGNYPLNTGAPMPTSAPKGPSLPPATSIYPGGTPYPMTGQQNGSRPTGQLGQGDRFQRMAPPPGPTNREISGNQPNANQFSQINLSDQMSGMNISQQSYLQSSTFSHSSNPMTGMQSSPQLPPTANSSSAASTSYPHSTNSMPPPTSSGMPPSMPTFSGSSMQRPPQSMMQQQQQFRPRPPQNPPPPSGMIQQQPPPTSLMGMQPPPPASSMMGMQPPPASSMMGMQPPPPSMAAVSTGVRQSLPPPIAGGMQPPHAMGGGGGSGGYSAPPNMYSPPTSQIAASSMPPPTGMYNINQQQDGQPNLSVAAGPLTQGNAPMGGMLGPVTMPPMQSNMAGTAPGPQKRLDPDHMPSPIQVIEDDKNNFENKDFGTGRQGQVPPLVTTNFHVIDQGNCSPRFIRATMYNIPCTQDMLKNSMLPLGVVVNPFSQLVPNELPPPLVDHGTIGPVRCNRCKAYMSPFMLFIDGGRRFQCNFCNCITEVPTEYFQHLDHTGRRIDALERPELSLGSYEFLATKEYCKNNKEPNQPAFIFMIDVTSRNIRNGMVSLLCKKLISLLDSLPKDIGKEESSVRVGFVTYNNTLHFYNIKGNLAQPQMMIVSDIGDIFMPLLDGFLVQVSEARSVITSLLEQIPTMFADTQETEVVLGPVVQAGLEALKAAECAGKLFIFHSSLPLMEAPGKIKNREDQKLLGTDKEKVVLSPQTSFYTKLGENCAEAGCSVDLFLFPHQHIDIATIGQLCTLTGGQCYKYQYFQSSTDGDRFIYDLKRDIEQPIAFDAIMRVRTSTGIRPTNFYGSFHMSNTTDVELASIDSGKAVTVEIKHDDKLQDGTGAFIQAAVLYTSVSGQRRLRIHNLSFNCCSQMADMYRSCEMDTITNLLAKQSIYSITTSTPKAIREHLINQCATILTSYRRNCASPSSPGQLILPECMKLLPLYTNCIMKSDALGGSEISTDDRSWLMQAIAAMDVFSTNVYFYPRLLPLHNLNQGSMEPAAVRCSSERLKDNCVYLLENGISMFMWIGLQVDSDWLQNVFGVSSASQIDIDSISLLQLDNPVSANVRAVIERVRKQRPRYMKLTILRQRDPLEPWFKHFLVEDRGKTSFSSSYVDFLCHMHKEIRNLMS